MKYIVLIGDGMSDYKVDALKGRTPLQVANKPCMDYMARNGIVGYASTVPEKMVAESDTANLCIMGYDPKVYSKGRSPLEALSIGIHMDEDETAFRCNVVTLSEGEDYDSLTILDHSADEISTEEADVLIKAVEAELGTENMHFHTGTSYRHCLLWKNAPALYPFARPHDILGQQIGEYLPKGELGRPYYELMKKSHEILNHHPLNEKRRAEGKRPANSCWFWSPGKKPMLPSFEEKYGVRASVISAVDLIKGIGICAKMKVVEVEGATGNIHTNFAGKAQAALDELLSGADLVYLHVEAPDECGHRAEVENKVLSIEYLDKYVLSFLNDELTKRNIDFKVLLMPDHPTPLELRTHVSMPVPFVIYSSCEKVPSRALSYDEFFGDEEGYVGATYFPRGHILMDEFLK